MDVDELSREIKLFVREKVVERKDHGRQCLRCFWTRPFGHIWQRDNMNSAGSFCVICGYESSWNRTHSSRFMMLAGASIPKRARVAEALLTKLRKLGSYRNLDLHCLKNFVERGCDETNNFAEFRV